MKKLFILIVVFFTSWVAQAAEDGRETVNFNFGWRFHAGDIAGAEQPQFDDNNWRTVDVPHDFQIEQPWVAPDAGERPDNNDPGANVRSRLSSRGFKEMGIGWYRKNFVPDVSWKGKRVLIDFEGIMYVGDVYLNGRRIGGTDYGYVGFEIDLTQLLQYGKPNVIAVKADTREPQNSRWYTGGGLFRNVRLVVTDAKAYFMRHPLFITTPRISETEATVQIQAEIACHTQQPVLKTELVITDAEGRTVARQVDDLPFDRRMRTREYHLKPIKLQNPHLWDCGHPYLYQATVTLYREDGTVADRVNELFGIRSIEFSPAFGLKLNGKKVLLKGVANHHSLGALGAAAYDRAIEKRIRLLKEFGVNHIRTSHNPYSEGFMDLCDKYGILVVDELYDKWLDQYCGGRAEWTSLWQKDIPEFIKRDRNHPSVVFWSLGNELQQYWNLPFADWGVTPYRLQRELLKRYDDTRPVTVAMHPRYRSLETDSLPAPLVHETDIASYNYRYMYFPGDVQAVQITGSYDGRTFTNLPGVNGLDYIIYRQNGEVFEVCPTGEPVPAGCYLVQFVDNLADASVSIQTGRKKMQGFSEKDYNFVGNDAYKMFTPAGRFLRYDAAAGCFRLTEGEALEPFEAYIATSVGNPVDVYYPPLVTTGLQHIDSESGARMSVYATQGGISIYATRAEEIAIFRTDGALAGTVSLAEGENFYPLPSGIYIVKNTKVAVP